MAPSTVLARNVRPKRIVEEEYDEFAEDDDVVGEGDSDDEEDDGASVSGSASAEDDEDDGAGSDDAEEEGADVEQQITNVSFGALKQAHDVLSRKRKRGSDVTDDQSDKLEALRKRLRQIKDEKASTIPSKPRPASSISAKVIEENDTGSDEEDSNSDSAPSEENAPSTSRTSKHAPAAQSSRHQVTRKRTVVDVPKRITRDPRFDALQQRSAHTGSNSDKAYSFLRDYQHAEISELKAAIKLTKSEEEKILLRRKVNSMENRLKAKVAKEREQEVVREHRREEKGRVREGKTPFYLKRRDVKERALVERFKGMKGKEREKVVEKRRKKEGQREKRRMPNDRRMVG